MKIITAGRTDLNDYFKLSGIREYKKLSHTPFLVFIPLKDEVKVELIDSIIKLLDYPNDTQVMSQWRGQWSSDFFQFKISELKKNLAEILKRIIISFK